MKFAGTSFVLSSSDNELNQLLLRLMALSLELPEDTFVKLHDFDTPGGTYRRLLSFLTSACGLADVTTSQVYEIVIYDDMIIPLYLILIFSFPRSEEDEVRTKNVWMKGHKGHSTFLAEYRLAHTMTDIGSITLLWSQPVAALQIQTKEGWRWVKHIDNALVCISPAIVLSTLNNSLDRQCWRLDRVSHRRLLQGHHPSSCATSD